MEAIGFTTFLGSQVALSCGQNVQANGVGLDISDPLRNLNMSGKFFSDFTRTKDQRYVLWSSPFFLIRLKSLLTKLESHQSFCQKIFQQVFDFEVDFHFFHGFAWFFHVFTLFFHGFTTFSHGFAIFFPSTNSAKTQRLRPQVDGWNSWNQLRLLCDQNPRLQVRILQLVLVVVGG